jgi:hypothetical protein
MKYSVEELNSSNAQDWNKLNEESPQGTLYHTLKWKEAVDQFAQAKPNNFIVYRDDEAVALCPFYRYKWKIKGLITMCSLLSESNIIVSCPDDPLVAKQIVLKCKEIIRKEGLAFTNITLLPETKDFFRSMNMLPHQATGWDAGVMTLDLQQNTPEMIWHRFLSRYDRQRIRRAERDEWKIEESKSEEGIRSFYECMKTNSEYRFAGNIPEFSFFAYLMKTFSPNEMLVFLLRKDETVAGGTINFLYGPKKTLYGKYAATNRQAPNRYTPVYSLMWHLVKKASAIGYTTVSFGGAPPYPDVHYRDKAKFGCRFEPRYSVTFPRLGALVNSAVTRLESISRTIPLTMN